jgi:hypothetical protein
VRLVLLIPAGETSAPERRIPLREEGIDIGGAADCDAVIDHPSVGTARVRLERRGEDWVVIDREGRGMCSVGGVPLNARQPRIVRPPHRLRLGELDLDLAFDASASESQSGSTREVALRAAGFVAEVAPAQPRVRVVEGPHMGEMLELAHAGPFRVGRGKSCDLLLESDEASREHFAIERQAGRILVKDLGSARGTFVGRSRLEAHRGAVWDPSRMVRAADAVFSLEVVTEAAAEHLLAPLAGVRDDTPVVEDAAARTSSAVISEPRAASVETSIDAAAAAVLEASSPAASPAATATTADVGQETQAPRARKDPTLLIVVFAAAIGILAVAALVALAVW